MSKDTQKYIGDVASIKVKKKLYLIYFFEPRVIGNYGRKHIGKH
jgi:hypothetical protein